MLPTDAGIRLIHLTKQARRAVALLSEAIQQAEPIAPTCNRLAEPSADEACAYLDRLPTIPSKRVRKQPEAGDKSMTANVLACLRTTGAWLTAADIRERVGSASPTNRVCAALARLERRGVVERRAIDSRTRDRNEFRAR